MNRPVKRLRLIVNVILSAVVVTLVVILVTSALPNSGTLEEVLRGINTWIDGHLLALLLLVLLFLCFTSVRGTLRNLFITDDSRYIWVCALSGILLLVMTPNYDKWAIPRRPHVFFYAAVVAGVVAIAGLIARLFIHRYVIRQGVLALDKEINSRALLAPEQIVVLDNLKELLLNQQQIQSIGLFGDWGTGKTSVFTTAKLEAQREDPKVIWAEIEPWRYTSQESLVLGFYEEIGRALERAIPGIQNSAAELLKIAEPLVRKNDHTGLLSVIMAWAQRAAKKQVNDPAEYIHRLLEREGRYLIVSVDNVERNSDNKQVLRTLQLVHFLRSQNVAYVFISEKDKLLAALSDAGNDKQAEYLEKFIEYEFELFPPNNAQLREFLNRLLADSNEGIPVDFKVDVPEELVRDFKTYRGVIKVFNQFIFELNKRFFRNGHYTIKLEDKLVLDHLHLKYPLLWRHIEKERDLYDGGSRTHDQVYYFVKDEAGQDKERQEKIKDAINEYVPKEKQEQVTDTIAELFPQTYHLLNGRVKKAEDHDTWRRERRVCESDVLDDYFARSQRQEAYDKTMARINELITELQVAATGERIQLELFRKFLAETASDENPRSTIRLLTGELEYQVKDLHKHRQFMRSLLRAYAKYVDFTLQEDEDGRLTPILAAIDRMAGRCASNKRLLNSLMNYLFADIESYTTHPSFMLRMLLYNQLYGIKQWGEGFQRLRRRGLRYVDDYYFNHRDEHSLFDPARGYEWRFVLYQWALSMKTGSTPIPLRGSKVRFKRVNDYVFGLWDADHKLAYRSLRKNLWGRHWQSENDAWQLDTDTLRPYDIGKLVTLIESLSNSAVLNNIQRSQMEDLLGRLKEATK